MVAQTELFIPLDGRIPSQNILVSPLDGTEVMEIVWPGTNAQGNTYQVTTNTLSEFFAAFPTLNTEIITAGASSIAPYMVSITDTRILVNKQLASATSIVFPKASTMLYKQDVKIVDFKGDAFNNNITITFSNGELCGGQSTIILDNDYDWTTITPYPGGGAWYRS